MSDEMDNREKLRDLIPAYVSGRMSDEQRTEFEKELASDPDLAAEVRELARIHLGISVADKLLEGHVRSEDIVVYAEAPDELDDATRSEIEDHLKACPNCAEEVKLCRPAPDTLTEEAADKGESFFHAVIRFLFPTRLGVRPGVAYLAVLVVACVSYFAARQTVTPEANLQSFQLVSSAVRGDADSNLVVIAPATPLVRLEFNLATIKGRYYELSLLDQSGKPRFTMHHYQHRLPFAIEIPTRYLTIGPNRLRVREETAESPGDREPETFYINFEVHRGE